MNNLVMQSRYKINYGGLFRELLIIAIVLCISLPISIFKINELDIPLSIITLIIGVPSYLILPFNKEKTFFTICVCLSFISIGIAFLSFDSSVSIYPFYSLVYFFMPYFLFFSGYVLTKSSNDIKIIIRSFAYFFFITTMIIFISVFGGNVREEGELLGSWLGFKLYATYGVNSLAIYYATMFFTILIYCFFNKKMKLLRILLFIPAFVALIYLLLGSLSREAILGCVVFLIVATYQLGKFNKSASASLIFSTVIIIGFMFYLYKEQINDLLFARFVVKDFNYYSMDNLDTFTSGRISLINVAISDILRNPFWGNGFHGFQLNDPTSNVSDLVGINSSPHNQYITAIWKMGLIPGIFYFLFLYRSIMPLYKMQSLQCTNNILFKGIWSLILVYLIVFCIYWDTLLVPLLGMFIMFILGSISKLKSIVS